MQALNNRRIRRWVSWLAVPAVLALMVTAALSQTKKDAEKKKKQEEPPPAPPNKTSYDQIAPVLLGQETFQERMAKDKASSSLASMIVMSSVTSVGMYCCTRTLRNVPQMSISSRRWFM